MLERALHVDHTTIYRWVQRYAPERDKRCRSHLKAQYISLKPKGKRRQESSHLAYYQKAKKQGAFDV